MVENLNYSDPVVLEVLKKMLGELPFSVLEDIIKHNKTLHNEFTKGGFHFDPKWKSRAMDIVFNDCKGDLKKNIFFFHKWYEKKPEYQRVLEPYFTSPEYLDWDKKDIKTKSDELRKIEQDVFDEFTVALPNNHVGYIIYFSYIGFDEELTAKWKDLAVQEDSEKIKLLRRLVFKKNDEIQTLKETINKILDKNEKEPEALEYSGKKIEKLDNQSDELQNERPGELIEAQKNEVSTCINEIDLALEQKKLELEGISIKVKEEKEIKESLEELNALKRKELAEYVDKGEKWKKALFPDKQDAPREVEPPGLSFSKISGDRYIIGVYTEFEKLLDGMSFSEDSIIEIWQTLSQLKNGSIFRVSNMDEMGQIEDFFQALGHQNGKFILHADVSWLTPGSLWKTKGHLYGCDNPVTFPDVIDFALKNPGIIFQVEILGANRAPIEAYLGPLLKTLPQKRKIIMDTHFAEIPINMFFFLQLDSDDYCAKPSPLLAQKLQSMNVISPGKISKEIFVPFNVLFKEE